MSDAFDQIGDSPLDKASGRAVSLRRDNDDFVVVFQPEEIVAFRNRDAAALRKVCRFLRWNIVSDTLSPKTTFDRAPASARPRREVASALWRKRHRPNGAAM